MQRFHRLRRCFEWAPILISTVWLIQGCGQSPAPPIVDLEPAPHAAPDLEFEVSLEPQEDDPRQADVWVSTSKPALWKSLPRDPAAPEWHGLVVVRTKEEADALPIDQSSGNTTPPGLKGEYAIVEGRLRFRLAEPLHSGGAYRVEFHRSAIPGFDLPGAPPTLPIVLWHIVPERKADGPQ
jgi:hypothetical protein